MTDRASIFVSCASVDRAFAHRVIDALAKRLPPDSNVDFIFDTGAVSPGGDLFVGIAETLSRSDGLIVVISPASERSAWVRAEIAWALSQKHGKLPIFPIVNGQVQSMPDLLLSRVYIDFTDEDRFETNVEILARGIQGRLSQEEFTDSRKASGVDGLANDYIERQKAILNEQELRATSHLQAMNVRLRLAFVFMFLFLGTVSAALIAGVFFGGVSKADTTALAAMLSPLTGLFGIVVGYYFGQSAGEGGESKGPNEIYRETGTS